MVKKKSKKRGSLTHVALVCDDTTLQPLLPQFIIGNEHLLRVCDLEAVDGCLANNIILVRAKSSWITVELFIVLLEMLRKTLDTHKVQRTPILLLDCCPVHVHGRVWKAARKNAIHLCFVPASLTWLMQPLDVKILHRLKAFVRKLYRRSQIENGASFVPVVQIIKNLAHAIRKVLQGYAWSTAFDACGYSDSKTSVTCNIKKIMTESGVPSLDVVANKPERDEILNILPRNRSYELETLFWDPMSTRVTTGESIMLMDASGAAPARRIGLPASSSTGFPGRLVSTTDSMVDDVPIALRTRSHSRLLIDTGDSVLIDPAAAASSAECPSLTPSLHQAPLPRANNTKRPRARALPLPRPQWKQGARAWRPLVGRDALQR